MKKTKNNPITLQEAIGVKFDYFIDRLHCRGTKERKMRYADMCAACREASHHNKTLKVLREQVMEYLDAKTLSL